MIARERINGTVSPVLHKCNDMLCKGCKNAMFLFDNYIGMYYSITMNQLEYKELFEKGQLPINQFENWLWDVIDATIDRREPDKHKNGSDSNRDSIVAKKK